MSSYTGNLLTAAASRAAAYPDHLDEGPVAADPGCHRSSPLLGSIRMSSVFVPIEFGVPRSFEGPGFHLEPLSAEHNERDHAAWMSSIEHIAATPGVEDWNGEWPVPMSLEDNLGDLVMHADEFEERTAFAYSILDGDEVIGCLYIDPPTREGHDADVRSWVRESRAELDAVVWHTISNWLAESWPFANPYYAARD